MPRVMPGPPCQVCGTQSIAKSLCEKHYRRWKRHGHVDDTRPIDWGAREKNPLYSQWTWTNRVKEGRAGRWDDFYNFLEDVGEKPDGKFRLKRIDIRRPWGPDNFYWKEELKRHPATKAGLAARQREWRSKNLLRAKSYDLKRNFGISIDQYHDLLEKHNGLCAICKKPETTVIRGKVLQLAIDHCHATGEIRGLLCVNCNKGLGHFMDSKESLQNAIKYLSAQS